MEFTGFDKKHKKRISTLKARKRKMYSKEYIRSCMTRLTKEGKSTPPLMEARQLVSVESLEVTDQEDAYLTPE